MGEKPKLTEFPASYRGITREEFVEHGYPIIPPKGVSVEPGLAARVKRIRDKLREGVVYDSPVIERLDKLYIEIYELLHPFGKAAQEARRDPEKAAAYKRTTRNVAQGSTEESEEKITPEVLDAQARLESARGDRTDLIITSLGQIQSARSEEVAQVHSTGLDLYKRALNDLKEFTRQAAHDQKELAKASIDGAYTLATNVYNANSGTLVTLANNVIASQTTLITEQRISLDRERAENQRLREEITRLRTEITGFIIGGPSSITEAHKRLLEQSRQEKDSIAEIAIKEASAIIKPVVERFLGGVAQSEGED